MIRSISMVRSLSWLVLPGALGLLVLAGCKKEDEPAEYPPGDADTMRAPDEEMPSPADQTPPGTTPGAAGTAGQPPAAGGAEGAQGATATDADLLVPTVVAVDIDTRLAQMCGLPGSSVFFKFDSAKLGPEAKERLQQIAACATTGAAKGKELVLVGRADPTGTDEYNQKLGMSRAESVARYLRSLGVANARVETASKGEATAMKEPYGWPLERRVTVRLQEP